MALPPLLTDWATTQPDVPLWWLPWAEGGRVGVGARQSLVFDGLQLRHIDEAGRCTATHTIQTGAELWKALQPRLDCGGPWFGWLAYELYPWCDDTAWDNHRPALDANWPLMWWVQPLELEYCPPPRQHQAAGCNSSTPSELAQLWTDCSLPSAQYDAAAESILAAIRQGELYQANLSCRWLAKNVAIQPLDSFEQLLAQNPAARFSAYVRSPWGEVVSNSPERLLRIQDGVALTEPIAGTRKQQPGDVQGNQALEAELASTPKEQAEHRMLVDLARNDLGISCKAGSVTVPSLLRTEAYRDVVHLVSTVTGQLAVHPLEALRQFFPAGTITGCPKIRTIQTLAGLEPVPRGLYTGALGWYEQGDLDFNILIRSLFYTPRAHGHWDVAAHGGAGIVADSHPTAEARESWQKIRTLSEILASFGACHC